jgi:predicted permease
MSTLVEIAYNIIAPIFIVVALSFWLDRRIGIDPASLSRLVIYLFSPSLVLYSLSHSDLNGGEATRLIITVIVMSLLVAGLAWFIARGQQFTPRTESAFVMSATLINAGNYGIPLNRFAFGADGESRAVIFTSPLPLWPIPWAFCGVARDGIGASRTAECLLCAAAVCGGGGHPAQRRRR